MPIKVLEPALAAQIAAGEVVERPASVVKELVENSLDAGCSQIVVEIKGGGIDQVRVTDDGEGIPAPEVALAFQHHATSKLNRLEQLDAIATLGFRGEAIPSIAVVSRMTMTTRPASTSAGHRVEYQWGQPIREGSQGCPPGTSVAVSNLFGNLPARRKFLKSSSAEAARIRDLVERYALAYPGVKFQLVVEGRVSVATPGTGKANEALLAVYGADVATEMLALSGEDPESGYRVRGFVSTPQLTRANRTYLTFFVNHRWIQSRMLSFAVEEAYHGLLPERRYPLAVLDLDLPYAEVDVNSHPAKREVRFRDERKVYATIQRAVRATLMVHSPVPEVQHSSPIPSYQPGVAAKSPSFFRSGFDNRASQSAAPQANYSGDNPLPAHAVFTPQQALPSLNVVGQIKLTYIIAEGPDGMYLVDQHAAHERVVFDRLRRQAVEQSPEIQPLLSPETLELTPAQAETFHENADFLKAYGFDVEVFGGNGYLLRTVPSVLSHRDPAQSLVDILDMVSFEGLLRQHEDALAATIACHSAIRAGKSLTLPEMQALLEQLETTDNPHTCPHGRPTLIHFSEYQMEREFGRR